MNGKSPSIHRAAGLGGSGTTQVFTHCILSIPNGLRVPGAANYSERALLLAREGDVVCLLYPPDDDYLGFLGELGIGPRVENIVVVGGAEPAGDGVSLLEVLLATAGAVDRIVDLAANSAAVVLNASIGSHREFALAALLRDRLRREVLMLGGNPLLVDRVNEKHVVRHRAQELGVPVAPGEVVHIPSEHRESSEAVKLLRAAVQRQSLRTGRALVRGSRGASGTATAILGSPALTSSAVGAGQGSPAELSRSNHLLQEFIGRDANRTYLVDEMHEPAVSPNVLMYVEPVGGTISCLGVTDQRLDAKLAWQGNRFPTTARTTAAMCQSAFKLCEWLQMEGYSGFAGFDFVEYRHGDTGQPAFFLAELNARVNGVTYPLAVMQRLNERQSGEGKPLISAFVTGNRRTSATSFRKLKKVYGRLFFDHVRGAGMFVYNTGCLASGILHYGLFGGSMAEVLKLEAELEASDLVGRSASSRDGATTRPALVPKRRKPAL
jgi:hypothetical protein